MSATSGGFITKTNMVVFGSKRKYSRVKYNKTLRFENN